MSEPNQEQLIRDLARIGYDLSNVNPRYVENHLFPFLRALRRDPDYTGRTAGVYFFRGVPVTEEEYRELGRIRTELFQQVTQDVTRRRVIAEARNLARADVGTTDQRRAFLDRVIRTQPDWSIYADVARDAFENPDDYDQVRKPDPGESFITVQEEIRSRLERMRG